MITIKAEKDCCGCEACTNICPKQCISMQLKDGFYYPNINENNCIDCHLCEKVCPITHHNEMNNNKRGIAGYIKDDQVRFNSTSGGVSFLLCKQVIEEGGTAYGVSFDAEYNSVFSKANNINDLEKFQGSKYPQSRVGNIYKSVKEDLLDGKKVIFVGTPCQVYGLNNYLGKKYDNAIMIDLICHGVPSPAVWHEYLKNLFPTEKIRKIIFKHKEFGWKKWHVRIETDKGIYSKERGNDPYMSSYLCGYNVRPSCFQCMFKGNNRVSDITIADGWGIPEADKELNDGKGLSSLIINTEKGERLFCEIKEDFIYKEFNLEDLLQGNVAYTDKISSNIFRKQYLKNMQKKGVLKTLNMYAISSLRGKIYMRISNYINRIVRK